MQNQDITVDERIREAVRKTKATVRKAEVVPAAPGYNLVGQIWEDGKIVDIRREPILAWRIETTIREDGETRTYGATPITLEGDAYVTDRDKWAVEYPDGRCRIMAEATYHSHVQVLIFWQEEQRKLDAEYRQRL